VEGLLWDSATIRLGSAFVESVGDEGDDAHEDDDNEVSEDDVFHVLPDSPRLPIPVFGLPVFVDVGVPFWVVIGDVVTCHNRNAADFCFETVFGGPATTDDTDVLSSFPDLWMPVQPLLNNPLFGVN
jgi:hypothetical protein